MARTQVSAIAFLNVEIVDSNGNKFSLAGKALSGEFDNAGAKVLARKVVKKLHNEATRLIDTAKAADSGEAEIQFPLNGGLIPFLEANGLQLRLVVRDADHVAESSNDADDDLEL